MYLSLKLFTRDDLQGHILILCLSLSQQKEGFSIAIRDM